ncbi:MAG: hypothetical protein QOE26_1885 [Verrucomicrobiota bacterium]|jgi:hypothetical protein
MPLRAFDEPALLDIQRAMTKNTLLWPIHTSGVTPKINFDGLVTYAPSFGGADAYVQLFRDGCIEAVNANILLMGRDEKFLYSQYEALVESALRKYLSFLEGEGFEPPIFIALSLVNANGYRVPVGDQMGEFQPSRGVIDRSVLLIPETRVDAFAANYYGELKDSFDRVWQACGWIGSLNYEGGEWIRKAGV